MINLEEIKKLAGITDSIDLNIKKLEKSYSEKDGEAFNKTKNEILDLHAKISEIIQ